MHFAASTITMPVTASGETANFSSAGATLYLTPTVPESFTSTGTGTPYVFNLIYSQPGNLFVPAEMSFPALPVNWIASYGPATMGFSGADSGEVTVSGVGCVDEQPSFAVTATDLEPTPYPRAFSAPETIVKDFASTITVTQQTTNLDGTGGCNDPAAVNAGDTYLTVYGDVVIDETNICSPPNGVVLTFKVNTCGTFKINGQTVSSGGSVTLGSGSYPCTWAAWWTNPTLIATAHGQSATLLIPDRNSTNHFFSTSY